MAEFYVGDRVKYNFENGMTVSGILEPNLDGISDFPLLLKIKANSVFKLIYDDTTPAMGFTKNGRFVFDEIAKLQMVEKFVPKEAYYRVLYRNKYNGEFGISANVYVSEQHFISISCSDRIFMQLLESTKEMK